MVNWFTWPWSLLNTKFTLILYPHILKISLRLSNYGSRYSLADNQRSNSEITHPHCLAFMREKIDASSVLSLNNLIKINTWILTWCRNQTKKNYFWRQRNLVSHYHWCHHPGPKHLIVWNHNQWRIILNLTAVHLQGCIWNHTLWTVMKFSEYVNEISK